MTKRFPTVIGQTLAIAALLATALAPISHAEPKGKAKLKCPSPTSAVRKNDIRDVLCASVLTGTVVESTASALRKPTSTELVVVLNPSGLPADTFTVANPTGSTVLSFPANSLFDNFPGHESYNPDLPIGILVQSTEASALMASPSGSRPDHRLYLSSSGVSQTGSDCGQLSSNSNNSNTTDAAFYAVCYRYYKPSGGDSSPDFKWRQLFSTGSAHGGNSSHHLLATYNRTQVLDTGNLDDWKPSGSKSYSSCTTRQDSLSIVGPGFSVTISDTYDICPDKYGLQFLDLPTDKFWYGWNGDKGCGGGSCDYIGNAGGYSAKIPENDTWSHSQVMGISWG
jgi:hypothetical protein